MYRAKVRPCIIVSLCGPELPKELRPSSSPKWQTAPTLLVAPYYGVEASEGRGGWHLPLVERIKKCEYPQFMLDQLPGANFQSVLRLDHIQPIGRHHNSWEPKPACLSDGALEVFDEWLTWLKTGDLDENTVLAMVRGELNTSPAPGG